ncbi:hypothetical protein CCACVL1_00627 [Corchorus capsularis]|uniref:Uncharacterized protein n=1 Tax=Corchorus capsularis TaxID=210143 RepID=A0A1R3KVU4_COCAP|nr:hypothetical protein CCACVL1_00627 [Corchorus capsularis]
MALKTLLILHLLYHVTALPFAIPSTLTSGR